MSILKRIRQYWRHGQRRGMPRYGRIPACELALFQGDTMLSPCTKADYRCPRPNDDGEELEWPARVEEAPGGVTFVRYRTAHELLALWRACEKLPAGRQLSAVLVLPGDFDAYLPDVVQRRARAAHLVVTSAKGRLPGTVSRGDLAISASALGWLTISFEPEVTRACREMIETLEADERCIIFWPDSLADEDHLELDAASYQS
ncbi:MAG: hypothetical protein KF708_05435 [Pirellulales bacterium]|nr:hypothetical protein [Pirellulales bacterium]